MSEDDGTDPPNPNRVYRNYLLKCRRLGVKPTPQGRAAALFKDWTDTLAAAGGDPPTKH